MEETLNEHSRASRGQVAGIYQAIRDRICLLHYPPGKKLAEYELAEEFAVSRTPIRQALQRLEYDGLAEIRNGVGTTVTVIDRHTFEDIFTFRMRLSELIGDFPAPAEIPAVLSSLDHLIDMAEQTRNDRDMVGFWRLNHALQDATGKLIGNQSLRETHTRYYFLACRIWYSVIEGIFDDQSADFIVEAHEIVKALKAGDLRAVGFIQRNHIALGMHRIAPFFRSE